MALRMRSELTWDSIWRGPGKEYAIGLGLTLLAAVLRFWNLGGPSLWFDEALNVQDAGHPFSAIHRVVLASPPLFHYVIRGFLLVFGRDDFWLRVPSALFGTLTIPLAYLLFRRWFGAPAALWTALLWALSPFHIVYSQELRMYSLVALEALAMLYLWDRVIQTDRPRDWVAFVLVSLFGLYTHNWFLFYAAVLGMGWLCIRLRDRQPVKYGLIAFVAMALLWLPWLPLLIAQTHQPIYTEPSTAAYHLRRWVQAFTGVFVPSGHDWVQVHSSFLKWLGGGLGTAFFLYGLLAGGIQRQRVRRIGLFAFGGSVILTFAFHVGWQIGLRAGRHTIIFLPAFFAVIAHAFVPHSKLSFRLTRIFALVWMALWISPVFQYLSGYDKAPWKAIGRAIQSKAVSGDAIQYKDVLEFDRISLNYYLPDALPRVESFDPKISGQLFWPVRTIEVPERIKQVPHPWRVVGAYPAGKETVLWMGRLDPHHI